MTTATAWRQRLEGWEPWLVPAALVALAAVLRFIALPTRGTWEADQGHDMLVLRTFVRDGVVPLLGPPTSIGDVHHGAWYYYLLSPVAFLTGGDSPLAIVATIALAGTAAVAVAWWLGRAIAGPWAGALAGLTLAVSTAAVDESTFIWNPNLIALSSGLALSGAWLAWRGASPWWWLLAAVGTAVTMQCHILGVALLPVVAIPFVLDARRRPLGRAVPLAIVGVIAAAYLPLAVNELTTGFAETDAALAYLAGGREPGASPLPVRFAIVGLRVVSWPLVGLITDAFVPAVIATVGVVLIVVVRRRDTASRWLGLGLLWSAVFLTLAAPSLAVVVRGLPNDHYHAFADPMVVVLVGLGIGALLVPTAPRPAGPALAVGALVLLVGWNLTHQPPAVHPDGGWPGGEAAGDRVIDAFEAAGIAPGDVVRLRSLPDFKSTEAVAYPLDRRGWTSIAETSKGFAPGGADPSTAPGGWVLLCDDRFRDAIGAPCGGAAEDAAAASAGMGSLLDRFEAAPERWISVYDPG